MTRNTESQIFAAENTAPAAPKKTGIYIHIPYCKSKCGYCGFVSVCDTGGTALYKKALIREIEARGKAARDYSVDTVYFGGGTPSVLPRGQLGEIMSALRDNFRIEKDAEITTEANPESAGAEFMDGIAAAGFNRLSLGLQTDDDALLKKLGRIHTYADFLRALKRAETAGFTNVSCDLMFGLPSQTLGGLTETVINTTAIPLVKHISLYALKIEENTPFYDRGIATCDDLQADMYEIALQELKRAGFMRYEVSNFSRAAEYVSRHNSRYWELSPYIGIGAAAHSFFNGKRRANTSNVSKYILGGDSYDETALTPSDFIEEYIMLSLRTSRGIDLKRLKNEFGYDLAFCKRSELDKLKLDGFIDYDGDTVRLADNAYFLMNSIILKLI